jgi:hypothetical protein
MLTYGVVLLRDNIRVHPHKAPSTRSLKKHFNWELSDHPSYSPDLDESDYHLFTYQRHWLRSERQKNNEEMVEGVKTWLSSRAYKDIFLDTSAPIPAITKLRNSLIMYVHLLYIIYLSQCLLC